MAVPFFAMKTGRTLPDMNARFRKLIFGLLVLPLAPAWAAPVAYSVNSDEANGDSLYQIDLAPLS